MGTSTMPSLAALWLRQSIMVQSDQSIVLRKTNSISSSVVALSLVLAGAVSIGDITCNVQAATGKLNGVVVAGARFQFGGSGQEYTVSATVKSNNSGVVGLTFTPSAAAGHASGSPINFTISHIDYTCPVVTFPTDESQIKLVEGAAQQKIIPASDNYPAPDVNDQLGGSMVLKVIAVDINGLGYYHCYLGK